jgi:hypothetical protein
MIRNSKSLV